jgi:hypothetical protein
MSFADVHFFICFSSDGEIRRGVECHISYLLQEYCCNEQYSDSELQQRNELPLL